MKPRPCAHAAAVPLAMGSLAALLVFASFALPREADVRVAVWVPAVWGGWHG